MLLIASGQYVVSELYAEFGGIPPAFLPLGNQRLYVHQVRELQHLYPRICLTLPSDFEPDAADAYALGELEVGVCKTPSTLSLGAAMHEALQRIDASGPIDILFGDTLVYADEVAGSDWIAVGDSSEFYHWHYESNGNGNGGAAWAGMFSFSDAVALRRMLHESDDFIPAVIRYANEHRQLERRHLKRWLDFGHVHTYFHSRRAVTTQRHFNCLSVADGILTKSSDDREKMLAEARWFETAPPAIKAYLPNYIGSEPQPNASYSLEYLPLAALNELYVFGRLPVKVWKKIFAACDRYLGAARSVPVIESLAPDFGRRMYLDKTLTRLRQFAQQTGIDTAQSWRFNGREVPSLRQMAEEAAAAVAARPPVPSFIHGDFCFSNILFDFRSDRIKLIDPRGMDVDGNLTSFGDFRYDIGKLAHSVIGLYDAIVASCFRLSIDGQAVSFEVQQDRSGVIREAFLGTLFAGRTPEQWTCYPVMVLLFLSMLPLHVDHPRRQQALMANCMRVYCEWKG